eukprot:jgi/Botrbrau1/8157/Bobra.357_2s0005.1
MALLSLGAFARGPPPYVLMSERHELVISACIPHHPGLRRLPTSNASRIRVGRSLALKGRIRERGSLQVVAVFERYTERAIKAVMLAQQEAKLLGSMETDSDHLVLGLIAEEKPGFFGTGVTIDSARGIVEQMSGRSRRQDLRQTDMPFSANARKILEAALSESKKLQLTYVTPELLLIAIVASGDNMGKKALERMGVNLESLRAHALKRIDTERDGGEKLKKVAAANDRRSSDQKSLQDFCRDLVEEARQDRTDPIFGRQREVMRVVQILGRRLKNNPILLGEAGVGKTAIAEGLARAIVDGKLPDGSPLPRFLQGKRILQLDVPLLIAGAKERGELESRIRNLLAEVASSGNVILMIDEIHSLVGAGSIGRGGGGGLDVANLLKPALARGKLQCIGATTLDEHRKHIEQDAALERRFQPVIVGEPSLPDAMVILYGLKERYEKHHRCIYTAEAVEAAVRLSARYIADRHLPDKAIDLLDEAGSRVRVQAFLARQQQVDSPDSVMSWRELQQVLDAKTEATQKELYEEASLLRTRELEMKARLVGPVGVGAVPYVTQEDIEAVVSMWTGIPVEHMLQDERDRLQRLPQALKEKVIGQKDAVDVVSRALLRSRSGLKNPNRPIAAMLFCGPTGVGKTELTRVLSEYYYGGREAMIRLDMSEYMERHTVSRLIGSPPGYVGHGEGGLLTEAVRRKPHSVVLLDEIEKAHPDIFNILLQVLEDGRLTDSQGRVVSFNNTLIIMTSNVGSNVIAKGGGHVGFSLPSDDVEDGNYAKIRTLVQEELKAYFRPELLNRLDEVVIFRQLGLREVRTVADLVLAETAGRISAKGISLEVTASLMRRICEKGYDKAYGARPLKRAITEFVDDPLCDALLRKDLEEGDIALLDCNDNGGATVTVLKPHQRDQLVKSEIVYSSLNTRQVSKDKASVSVNA